ncbi:MAG: hypothetical protein D6734_13405, partial [Candidatus Schekmanbacteria bacterium]
TYNYIEENFKNALICYPFGWREIFYPYKGSTNLWLWTSPQNEKLPEIVNNKKIYIYTNGYIKADSFKNIFWVFPVSHPSSIEIWKKIEGNDETFFDYYASRYKREIREVSLMTLEQFGSYPFPISFYISKIK